MDLIDRQQGIDALKEHRALFCDNTPDSFSKLPYGEKCRVDELDNAIATLVNLPSAQPEQKWIPCDERMPEEHEWIGTKKFGTTMSDEVYVTFENSKGERFTKHLHFHNGELSRYDKQHMDVWYKDYKPIAWMPLPEPYQSETERRTDGR